MLETLRWKADMVVTNYDGQRVWLKEAYNKGVRIGITDCCLEEHPCEWHKAIQRIKPPLTY